jgi:uncharacterized OB-fold protein
MALQPCWECGLTVSSKAAGCPHCGAPVEEVQESEEVQEIEEVQRIEEVPKFRKARPKIVLLGCSKCGRGVSSKAAACPDCGAPVEESARKEAAFQKESRESTRKEAVSQKNYHTNILANFGLAGAALLVFLSLFGDDGTSSSRRSNSSPQKTLAESFAEVRAKNAADHRAKEHYKRRRTELLGINDTSSSRTSTPRSYAGAEPSNSRSDFAEQLTKKARKAEVKIQFSVDPNDDKTLIINRISTQTPKELRGDWSMYLYSVGTTKENLKAKGFNKVRIYTSQSEGIRDYVLKRL